MAGKQENLQAMVVEKRPLIGEHCATTEGYILRLNLSGACTSCAPVPRPPQSTIMTQGGRVTPALLVPLSTSDSVRWAHL